MLFQFSMTAALFALAPITTVRGSSTDLHSPVDSNPTLPRRPGFIHPTIPQVNAERFPNPYDLQLLEKALDQNSRIVDIYLHDIYSYYKGDKWYQYSLIASGISKLSYLDIKII